MLPSIQAGAQHSLSPVMPGGAGTVMVQVCASGDLKGELIRAKRAPPGPGSAFRSVVARERGHDAEAVKEYARGFEVCGRFPRRSNSVSWATHRRRLQCYPQSRPRWHLASPGGDSVTAQSEIYIAQTFSAFAAVVFLCLRRGACKAAAERD